MVTLNTIQSCIWRKFLFNVNKFCHVFQKSIRTSREKFTSLTDKSTIHYQNNKFRAVFEFLLIRFHRLKIKCANSMFFLPLKSDSLPRSLTWNLGKKGIRSFFLFGRFAIESELKIKQMKLSTSISLLSEMET